MCRLRREPLRQLSPEQMPIVRVAGSRQSLRAVVPSLPALATHLSSTLNPTGPVIRYNRVKRTLRVSLK